MDGSSAESSRVTGFTDKVKSICLVIPIQAVNFYNNKFRKTDGDSYLCAYVVVGGHDSLLPVCGQIEKSGFTAETDLSLSREMLSLKTKFETVLFLMTDIVLLLAIFAVVFSTMIAAFHRLEYYRLLRVLGASRIFITATLLFKYSLIGSAGSFCGYFLMQKLLPAYMATLKIQGFEIMISAGKISVWFAAAAGALLSVLAALPALFLIHSAKMNLDQ
jgi:predicted lysophospholipase L1 biosynthesis ABC-type transport system permease subunit